MLKPKELQNLPKGLTDIYSELSEFVLRDIAQRISKAAEITDIAEYQLYRARALGLSTKEITQKIAKINGVAETEIEKIIREAAAKSDEFDRKMLGADGGAAVPLAENEQLQIFMAAEIDNTHGLCRNYTGTLGFAEVNAAGNVVYSSMTDFLRKQMDMAHMKVASGVTDYNTAVRQACRALSESGLRTVYYESGRSDRIEVAVRRALMTSVSQVTQRISEQNAEEFGADGWEISAHSGARPSHAVYQGRQFPNSKYELIVRPLIEDYNCRHSAFPIIMGVSQPAYTEEELKNIDPPPFTYEGRTYTAYEAQQQMRKMERSMRKQKDRCIVADAAGDKDTFTAASIKLRRQKDIYEDFCKAAGTYTEYERTFVQGYDRHLAGRTGAVTRAQNKFKNAQVTLNQSPPLTNGGNGGIIDIVEQATGAKHGVSISIQDAVKGANPNYMQGSEYRINCQRCVQAYELRRRGYDVIAKPKPAANNIITWGSECFIQPGQYHNSWEAFSLNLTKAAVQNELKSSPDGARYAIYAKWKGRGTGAHVFIAEKENGVIVYLDPQTGKQNVDYYFNEGKNGHFGFFRMDDKKITSDQNILNATVEVKKA